MLITNFLNKKSTPREMCFLTLLAIFGVILVGILILSTIWRPQKISLENAHVLITGGSSGIGKEVAKVVVKYGAHVTIVARNQKRLDDAKEEISKQLKDESKQKIFCVSVDISSDPKAIQSAVDKAVETQGPVSMLVNCAGFAISGTFEDTKPQDFKTMIDVNFLGSVYVTKAVLPSMKANNKGRIIFFSSQAGQIGLFGYTAYSPSKFALMGLSQSLQMEVKPYNIYVTLAFPPDTDTPGFAAEQVGKPEETQLISETAGLLKPEMVAKTVIRDSLNGKFQSSMGMDGRLLACLTSGMSPVGSLWEAVEQVLLMSVFRLVSLFYIRYFDSIVSKCKAKRETASYDKKTS